ncbi:MULTISPECIES: hypothetical protein [unclassified Providencia]|uniref:hypothetical protein n=1 Tax=unclassified Providencia TaxID=2633465 RepID=UPI00234B00F8|nr:MULTISPECIES: hypothetical protein [unclassified Providencia]
MLHRNIFISVIVLWSSIALYANAAVQTTTTTLTATIVASSCVGEIITTGSEGRVAEGSGTVDFGVVNPKTRQAPIRIFSLRLSESVGGKAGCSAFEAYGRKYPVATLSFGDVGNTQLDDRGVILRDDYGSDTTLRVQIEPLDAEGKFIQSHGPRYITASNAHITYPIVFAAKGLFGFQATLSQWDRVRPGRFNGSLTVTVVYR